jgi:autotransporter-associated beta strand protein
MFAPSLFRRPHTASIFAACALALCAGIAHAQSTTTWTGSAASGDWSTAGNWNGGAPTTSGTWALTFGNTTQTSSTNTIGGASDTVTLSGLTITSNTAVALGRTESRTLTLINNSSIYIGGTNNINHTSSIPLTLLGSSTVSGVSNRNLQWNAVISGTGSLSLTAGTLYLGLGVVNTFSGGLTISGGGLDVAGNSALGTGPLTINGGTLNARAAPRTVTNSGVVNGDFTFGGTNPLVLSGSFDLNGGTRIITANGSPNAGTMSGVISNGGITKAGLAPLVLSGANTYTGATTINSGTLQIGGGGTTGSLNPASTITGSAGATLAFNRTNTITQGTDFASTLSGPYNVTQLGSGTLVFNAATSYTGTTSINAGTLQLGSGGTAGALSPSSAITGLAGATLAFNRTNTITQGTDFASTLSGPYNVTQLGSGTLVFNAATSYTGTTSINAGTLQIGSSGTAGSLSPSSAITGSTGGTLAFSRSDEITQGTHFNSVIGGSINVAQIGSGTLTLSGANTYTGTTSVAAGLLKTSNANQIADGSPIQVTGGILRFGGNDTVAAIGGSGGTIDVDVYSLTSSVGASSTFAGSLIGNRTNVSGSGGSGFYKTGSGTLTLSGSVSLSADNSIFNQGNNRLQVSGGELVLAGTTTLANMQTRLLNGTTLRIASGSHAFNAGSRTGSGEGLTIQNGQVVVDGGVSTAATVSVGYGTGSANVFTMNTGTFTASLMTLGNNIGATDGATVNLNGGVLAAGSFTNQGGQTAISFNGGTLQMLGTSVVPSNTNPNGNVLALNVGNGGAILDTGTFANTISQGLAGIGSGGLTKLGSAQLTLAGTNTYSGATMISAGTIAFSSTSGLQGTSGVSIAGGAGLTYTGGATSFGKNITVTSGTGTVRNSGGGTLTLGGTLTKDGTVLRLTGGSFNVTGQIVGTSPNSDLLVDGTSTVTLSTVNSYNGPTFVNQSSTLIVGVNDAIPNGSIVTLGNATTTGTLTLGSNSDAIGGLAFGAGGGALRMTASATAATAQLTAASGTMNLSGGTLNLTGSGTSAGLYRLLSAQSITNSFTNITGTTAAYQIVTTSTSIDYQQRAVLGAVSVTNPVVSIITGGSAAFTYTVTNNALAGGAGLTFTGTGLSNVSGSSLGSANAANTSSAVSGLVFTGTSIGSSQQGTFTVNAPSSFGTTAATGTVSVNVLNHSLASFQSSDTATLSLDLGTYDTASGWTSGSGSLGFSLWNIASGGFTNADTAGLALYDVVFTSGSNVFATGLTNFANLASGTFNGYTASVLSPGSLTEGTYQGVYTLKFRDQQNLSGAANTRDLTLTANMIVVPEPGALALAGIGIGLAGWLLCRRQT